MLVSRRLLGAQRKYSPAWWAGTPVRFSQMDSFGHTPGLGAAERIDPFWGGMWTQGSSAVWVSKLLAEAQQASGLARLPRSLQMSPDRARSVLSGGRLFGARMAALGVLDQWRTVSAEQLAAFTGWPQLGSVDPASMVALFNLGIVDRGTFASALLAGANADRATLWRPSRSKAFDDEVAPLLSYEQLLGVTGGLPWDFRRQFDRHNLLSAELGLRAAQWCEVGTVLGEKLSTADLLAGTGLGLDPIADEMGADLTIVRPDGLRIAVELTASTGRDFYKKAERWAELLSKRSLASSGLMVVFVEAQPIGSEVRYGDGSTGSGVRSGLYKNVGRAAEAFPGTGDDRVANRMGVVSWRQWFPGPGMATEEFTRLEIDRPTGGGGLESRWERAAMLDMVDVPFDAHRPEEMTAVIDNASMLLGTPHWLRRDSGRAELWPVLSDLVEADWVELPTSPPVRPNRCSPVRTPQARGVPGVFRSATRSRLDLAAPIHT